MNSSIEDMAHKLILNLLETNTPTDEELQNAVLSIVPVILSLHNVELDSGELIRKMQAQFNVYQADTVSLDDAEGHREWMSEKRDSIDWAFWKRYLRYLQEEVRLPPLVLQRLDSTTERILGKLEDPSRVGPWDRRGMVVGQIQSGKTGSYTGLICRAIDAGYRLVIVLAGMHNSLRSQTQLRLDEGFLGFDTQRRQIADANDGFVGAALGVGRLIGEKGLTAASLTTSAEKGDFGVSRARSVGIIPGTCPVLLVVKKNGAILRNLRKWLLSVAGLGDPPRISSIPVLIIDDEADNASINTRLPDEEPTRVNEEIRHLLQCFDRRAYVGYTATPYANIYIDPEVEHQELGADLFPASFIEYLRTPTNYFGPSRLFGNELDDEPLPLHRQVRDTDAWIPDRHKNGHVPGPLPQSVHTALRSFLLARAARMARGEAQAHNSMLIHVTRYTSVQAEVRAQIEDELDVLKSRIKFGDGSASSIRAELESLWNEDFVPTTKAMPSSDTLPLSWNQIEPLLIDAVSPIVVKTINGTASDALEYFEHRASGLNAIVIGGDKLSRGLTLEGLTVSYYLRASKAFDTLLQMGRWFGYRPGYEDLCRLWTSDRLWSAYREVTLANEELIREFEDMASQQLTPRDYGLKVRNSVEGMLVTAANKMRAGTKLRVGYAGTIAETTVLFADKSRADHNLGVLAGFADHLDRVGARDKRGNSVIWKGVPGDSVVDYFFDQIATAPEAYKVDSNTIAGYVRNRLEHDELTEWTVAVMSNSDEHFTLSAHEIGLTRRSLLVGDTARDRLRNDGLYRIRRLLSPRDEAIDFSATERDSLLEESREAWNDEGRRTSEPKVPSGPIIRRARPVQRGLLLVYLIRPPSDEHREAASTHLTLADDPLVGFAVSFPTSRNAPAMDYVVNKRFLDELLGAGDDEDED